MKPEQLQDQVARRLSAPRTAHPLGDYISIVIGCFLMALGFRFFLNANGIVAGGVVGLSTVVQARTGMEPGLFQALVNLPVLAIGGIALGRAELARSGLGSLALPAAIAATQGVTLVTREPFLAALFAGVTYGVGLGLVLRSRGSVGGFSLLAKLLGRLVPFPVPAILLVLDATVILMGGAVFGIELALYGLIAAYVMRRAMDGVLVGFGRSFLALVISEHSEAIRPRILADMDRGLTVLSGFGGFTGTPRQVLMVVITEVETPTLRRVVESVDPKAFVVLMRASEVLGRGFTGAKEQA